MRIKLDENLPLELIAELAAMGHDVEHVHGEQLSGRPDPDVWQAAQTEQRLLITQDIALGDARMFDSRAAWWIHPGANGSCSTGDFRFADLRFCEVGVGGLHVRWFRCFAPPPMFWALRSVGGVGDCLGCCCASRIRRYAARSHPSASHPTEVLRVNRKSAKMSLCVGCNK
jgi:hypothetical protein